MAEKIQNIPMPLESFAYDERVTIVPDAWMRVGNQIIRKFYTWVKIKKKNWGVKEGGLTPLNDSTPPSTPRRYNSLMKKKTLFWEHAYFLIPYKKKHFTIDSIIFSYMN